MAQREDNWIVRVKIFLNVRSMEEPCAFILGLLKSQVVTYL